LDLFKIHYEKCLSFLKNNHHIDIIDFLKSPIINEYKKDLPILNIQKYYSLPFDKLLIKSKKYNIQVSNILLNSNDFKNITNEKVIAHLPDKYTLIELTTEEMFEQESSVMQHCVGIGSKYWDDYQNDKIKIWSLRDPLNKAHITFEVDNNKRFSQIKGKQNKKPAKKYNKYIKEIYAKEIIIPNPDERIEYTVFNINNIIYTDIESYENKLKKMYKTNNWEEIIDCDLIIPNIGFSWFTKIPNVKINLFYAFDNKHIHSFHEKFQAKYITVNSCLNIKNSPFTSCIEFDASDSGIESFSNGFQAENIYVAGCLNLKNIPKLKTKTLNANLSNIQYISEKFEANELYISSCSKIKEIPAIKCNIIYANDCNSLHTIDSDINVNYLNISHCPNLLTIPPFKCKQITASNSNLIEFPIGFYANKINVNDSMNFSIIPNIKLTEFSASNTAIESFPREFFANKIYVSYCKKLEFAPNIKCKAFDASFSSISLFPENFFADVIDLNSCQNVVSFPNCKTRLN
jgi:hypothetical protein